MLYYNRGDSMAFDDIDILSIDWGADFENIDSFMSDTDVDAVEECPEYKVAEVEWVDLDKYLYVEKYWAKVFDVMDRKKLSPQAYNELQDIKCNWRDIVNEVKCGLFSWGIPHAVQIPKANGKMRTVYVFGMKQRVLLSVLNRILSDYYSAKISPVCYSYKAGVTTISAVRDIKQGVYAGKSCTYDYGMKLDISKYFNSVSEERVKEMIEQVFAVHERGVIYELIRVLYTINYAESKGVVQQEYLSLIPGVAVSSFFANYCLREVDEHFRLNNIVYARYCDDIILFGKTEEDLTKSIDYIVEVLQGYGLSINSAKYKSYIIEEEPIDFLGLCFDEDSIDVSVESFKKMKHKIRVACRAARRNVELKHKTPEKEIERVIRQFNYSWFKCYIEDRSRFGWGYYAFRFITTNKTIQQIDFYFRDMLRYIKTGKWNSGNITKMPDEKLKELGYVSLTYMYGVFKSDFEVYREYVGCL